MFKPYIKFSLAFIFYSVFNGFVISATIPCQDTKLFFRAASDNASGLAPNEFYPRGRKFLFTAFSIVSPDLETVKKDGYTAIGPYYSKDPNEILGSSQKAGLPCMYSLGMNLDWPDPCTVTPSDEEIEKIIKKQMSCVANDANIMAWYVLPEEVRYWRENEMHVLEYMCELIRKLDLLKRPVWTYEANNRGADALAKTIVYQDYCGKGMYTNYTGYKDQRIFCRWSVEQEVEAIKKAKPSAVPLVLPEMYTDPEPNEVNLIRAWTRHDVYLGLVSGGKGVVIWSGYRYRDGFSRFQDYYDGYASTAKELTGPLNLGQVFLFGERRNDIKLQVLSGTAIVKYKAPDGNEIIYDSISMLNAAYGKNFLGSNRYLFLVNSSKETVIVQLGGLPENGVLVQDVLTFDEFTIDISLTYDVKLGPLEVKCLKFIPKTETK
jgi:hypothetical protein